MITNRFSKDAPVSMAQGRHGELIIAQGGGVRPARWGGTGQAVDAGMDAPPSPPQVTVQTPAKYYVARVDVTKPGACYYAPPEVDFSTGSPPDSLTGRAAKAAAYLTQAGVSEIRVLDGGKGYGDSPTVVLSDSRGKGAVIEAILEGDGDGGTPDSPCDSEKTGLTDWEIISSGSVDGDPQDRPEFAAVFTTDIPISGNGTHSITLPYYVRSAPSGSYTCTFTGPTNVRGFTNQLTYEVSGMTTGSCAVLRLKWQGAQFSASCTGSLGQTAYFYNGAAVLASAKSYKRGQGFSDGDTVRVRIRPVYGDLSQDVVIEGMTRGNEKNGQSPRYSVGSLVLKNGGSGYLVAPQIRIVSNSGFGAYGTCKVANGAITEVTLENSGGGYKTPPTVEVVSGGAEAFAVARPHLRGTYQCYYRFVDGTPDDNGGPIPSNLSPVTELDAGEGAASITWNIPAPTGRAKKVELWRTTGDQATTLYRIATLGPESFSNAPGPPSSLVATSGNAQLVLNWEAPASDGGSPVTGYVIVYAYSGGQPQQAQSSSPATSFTLANLTNGTYYTVLVAAVNAAGTGPYSNLVIAAPTIPT